MALDSYANLQASIVGWLWDRDDLTARIPDFISIAEAQFNREIRARDMETILPFSSGAISYNLPTDFLEPISLVIPGFEPSGGVVSPVSASKFREMKASYSASDTSRPAIYTIIGNSMYFAPTPQSSFSYELAYYARVPALSISTPTNWMLVKNPDVYLYGSLLQAAPYLEDEKTVGIWNSAFTSAKESINKEAENAIYQRSTLNAKITTMGN